MSPQPFRPVLSWKLLLVSVAILLLLYLLGCFVESRDCFDF